MSSNCSLAITFVDARASPKMYEDTICRDVFLSFREFENLLAEYSDQAVIEDTGVKQNWGRKSSLERQGEWTSYYLLLIIR